MLRRCFVFISYFINYLAMVACRCGVSCSVLGCCNIRRHNEFVSIIVNKFAILKYTENYE